MSADDDLFGKDVEQDANDDEFERHGRAIHELVADYLEEHDIPDSAGSVLLLNGAISMRMIGYATDVDPVTGRSEQDAEAWWAAIGQAARDVAASDIGDIVAIGLDGHGPTLVAVDAAGRPTRPAIIAAFT